VFSNQSCTHSRFFHQISLSITSRHLVAKQEETWREMSVNFGHKYLFHTVGILTCRKILQHRIACFTSPLKEDMLRIFIALKNPSFSAGLELQTLGLMANMITTRPPRGLRNTFVHYPVHWNSLLGLFCASEYH
jgi:hypothetical protein